MGGTIVDVPNTVTKRRRRSSHVNFKEEEEIINPGTVGVWSFIVLIVSVNIKKAASCIFCRKRGLAGYL